LVGRAVLDSPNDPRSAVSGSRRIVGRDVLNLQIDLMSAAWAIVRPEHLGALTEVSRCLAETGVLDSLSGLMSAVSGAVPFGDQDDENQRAWGRSSPSECTCRTEHSI
jgi:ATP-dependent protease HslVU (ClpYQ) ATPase subunit